jgi:putative peptidoglycan lipid II flippase
MPPTKTKLLQNASGVSIFTSLALLLTFIVQLVLADRFGATTVIDAYFAAAAIPPILARTLVLPLKSVFVPLYKETGTEKQFRADRLFSFTFWSFFSLFLLIGTLIIIFSAPLAHRLIPGASAETLKTAARLLRLIGVFTFFNGTYFATQALHVAADKFLIAYAGNAVATFITLAYTLIFITSQGVAAVLYGGILGFSVAFLLNLVTLPRPILLKPTVGPFLLRRFASLFLPLAAGSLIFRSTPLIDRYFASFLPAGEIAVLGYASRVLEGLVATFSTGLAVVILPLSSRLAAERDHDRLAATFSWGLRVMAFLITPVCAYLLFFSPTVIGIVFERGAFTPADTRRVALTITAYTGAIFALSLGSQLANYLYARKRHLTLVAVNLALIIPYVLLVAIFSRTSGVPGIAAAYSLLTAATVLVYLFLNRDLLKSTWEELFLSFGRFFIAAVFMLIILIAATPLVSGRAPILLVLAAQIVGGALTYAAALHFLGSTEIRALANIFKYPADK